MGGRWAVHYAPAYIDWLTREERSEGDSDAVAEWLEQLEEYGPPDDCVNVPGDLDLHVCIIQSVGAVVTMLAVMQDRTIIVREID